MYEEYWSERWTEPLCKYLGAQEIRAIRPLSDPPDVEFCIRDLDGRNTSTWGEITGSYYDGNEANWLWDENPTQSSMVYFQPDEIISRMVVESVKKKISKYDDLSRERGKGTFIGTNNQSYGNT